jgi:hypothetical protein
MFFRKLQVLPEPSSAACTCDRVVNSRRGLEGLSEMLRHHPGLVKIVFLSIFWIIQENASPSDVSQPNNQSRRSFTLVIETRKEQCYTWVHPLDLGPPVQGDCIRMG